MNAIVGILLPHNLHSVHLSDQTIGLSSIDAATITIRLLNNVPNHRDGLPYYDI